MNQESKKFDLEPSPRLRAAVLARLERAERRQLLVRRLTSASGLLISLSGLIAAIRYLVVDLVRSGFGQYAGLIFSDGRLLLNFWSDYLLSLIDSLPLVSLAVTLVALVCFLFATRTVAGQFAKQPVQMKAA